MGYTHYWRRQRALTAGDKQRHAAYFRLLTRDCGRLFAYLEDHGEPLAGPLGDGSPETTSAGIAFNGKAPCDYETLEFPAVPPAHYFGDSGAGAYSFEFCKTARRPYDPAVVAFLLLAKWRYGDAIAISSDGDAAELAPGAALLRKALPHLPQQASCVDAFWQSHVGGVAASLLA